MVPVGTHGFVVPLLSPPSLGGALCGLRPVRGSERLVAGRLHASGQRSCDLVLVSLA